MCYNPRVAASDVTTATPKTHYSRAQEKQRPNRNWRWPVMQTNHDMSGKVTKIPSPHGITTRPPDTYAPPLLPAIETQMDATRHDASGPSPTSSQLIVYFEALCLLFQPDFQLPCTTYARDMRTQYDIANETFLLAELPQSPPDRLVAGTVCAPDGCHC